MRHWQALARQSGAPGAFDRMVAMVLLVPQALDEVAAALPDGFPRGIYASIRQGMLAQAEAFIDELE